MPISGISQGLGIGGGATATISGAPGGGAPFIPNARSLLFDGANDYMTTASEITFDDEFTFSFWIKPVSGNEGFISTGSSGAGGPFVDWYGAAHGNKLVVANMGSPLSAVAIMPSLGEKSASTALDASAFVMPVAPARVSTRSDLFIWLLL